MPEFGTGRSEILLQRGVDMKAKKCCEERMIEVLKKSEVRAETKS